MLKKSFSVLASLALGAGVSLAVDVMGVDAAGSSGVSTIDSSFSVKSQLFEIGDKVVFAGANEASLGYQTGDVEMWVSDGTLSGTALLKDINPGDTGSFPRYLTAIGNKVIFSADDGTNGRELWVTDGTPDGTQMVKDLEPGSDGSWPGQSQTDMNSYGSGFTVINDVAYFRANTAAAGGEPWKSDGTADGTVMLADIDSATSDGMDSRDGPFIAAGDNVLFPGNATATYGAIYIQSYDGASVTELQSPLKKLPYGSLYGFETPGADTAWVSQQDSNSGTSEIWITDGTVSGSSKVLDGYLGSSLVLGSKAIFQYADPSGGAYKLWVTDGTAGGSALLKDISVTLFLGSANGKGYFIGNDGTAGNEYWVSDGTANGTFMLGDIYEGSSEQYESGLAGWSDGFPYGIDGESGNFYFAAKDGTLEAYGSTYATLWQSDGTEAGTSELSDKVFDARGFGFLNGDLVFGGRWGGVNGNEYGSGPNGLFIGRPGTDSSLENLRISAITMGPPSGPPPLLVPDFDPSVTEYSFAANTEFSTLDITAQISNAPGGPASCTVNGDACYDAEFSNYVYLDVTEPQFVEIVVTAADGSTTTYSIAVSFNDVVPTTTTTAPATTVPATTVPGSSSATPTLVTSANQELLAASAGSAKILINGELVEVELVQASEELRRTVGGARTFEQVRALQTLAAQMVTAIQAVLGDGVELPITVTNTSTGATISGLVTDPVTGDALPVPVEDVLLILNENLVLMVGGADGTNNPANIAFDGVLEFGEGGYVAVLAYGLTPGAAGEVVVMSTPQLLDTFTVDTDGGVAAQAAIPADIAPGEHTVVVAVDGKSASLGFRVLSAGTLPVTGGSSSLPSALAVLLAAAGAFGVLVVSRRRQSA